MKKRKPKPSTITVKIPPYGRMVIVGVDNDDALKTFRSNWVKLWPNVKSNLKSMLRFWRETFEARIRLKAKKWMAEGSRVDPDCFMGDQADLYLQIQFEEPPDWEDAFPTWDFFIKGTKVVHCQPVF